jgi:hypothetical protein
MSVLFSSVHVHLVLCWYGGRGDGERRERRERTDDCKAVSLLRKVV